MLKPLYSVILLSYLLLTTSGCNEKKEASSETTMDSSGSKSMGSVEKLDPELDNILDSNAKIEKLAEGFTWSEGPLWIPELNKLLFCDIPPNKIYSWSEEAGLELYLSPSGYTGQQERGGEPGSNGLVLNKHNQLVLCQHGDRRLAFMDSKLTEPKPNFVTITDNYEGKRLNSPNDITIKSNGEFYFTDPPYGLEKVEKDPAKELPFQGVYRVDTTGKTFLLTKELSRPNGIAFSPDEKTLYVSNSDPEKALWMAYEINEQGNIAHEKIFYDATHLVDKEKGLPDGLKVSKSGIIFASGPGGVWIFNKEAKVLGRIKTGEITSNCALDTNEEYLYMTADNYLLRIRLKQYP